MGKVDKVAMKLGALEGKMRRLKMEVKGEKLGDNKEIKLEARERSRT